jgi:hypothetical protein
LKSFATALTRVELNETNIKNIVEDLEELGIIDWDATQVCITIKLWNNPFSFCVETLVLIVYSTQDFIYDVTLVAKFVLGVGADATYKTRMGEV